MTHRPLLLTFPDSTVSVLSVCDTAPAALSDWVAQLPMAHAPQAAQQLHQVAAEIARLLVPPEARFEFLEIIRVPVHYLCTRIDRNATASPTLAESHSQLAQALQNELALGYKAVIRDIVTGTDELSSAQRDLLGHATHRALGDLSLALRRTYEFYTDAPARVWYELNQLFALAEERELTGSAYADDQPRSATQLTIADVYLRIAMLAAAKPNQLRPKDLAATYTALEHWTPRITIGEPADDTLFVVDLDADAQPSYRELGSHTGDNLRGIRTDVLVYELEAYLTEMASDVPVPDYISAELLRHLTHAWSVMKKRSFRRSASDGPMKVCIGLRTLHYYISGGAEFADQLGTTDALLRRELNPFTAAGQMPKPAEAGKRGDVWDGAFDLRGARIPENPNIEDPRRILLDPRRTPAPTSEASYPCYDTEIVDTSPSGYCVRWATPLPAFLQTGELLAVRERDDARWCIAVSRWIRHSDSETLMGLELLAPRAIAAAVRLLQRSGSPTEYNRAVLLPALEAIGQPAMLITPRMPFRESQKVQIRRNGIQATGQLMRRVRMTESFTQFTFRMLDGYLESTQIDLNMDSLWDTVGSDSAAQPRNGPSTGPVKGKK